MLASEHSLAGLCGLVLALMAQPTLAQQDNAPSLTDVLGQNNDTLSVLNGILQMQSELVDTLNGTTNITILAPSDDAFNSFLEDSNMSLTDIDPGMVQALLSYHVINGSYSSDNVTDMPVFLPTLLNDTDYANVTGGQVVEAVKDGDTVSFYSAYRKESNVSQADIEFSGGYIHVINEVLRIPQNLSTTAIEGNLTSAAGALTQADLVDTLEGLTNITVFAPQTEAFIAIGSLLDNLTVDHLQSVLEYHVVEGVVGYSSMLTNTTLDTLAGSSVNIAVSDGDVYVDTAKVLVPDVLIANGVLHIIDRVLNPNATDEEATPNPSNTEPAYTGVSTVSDIPFTSGVPTPTETQEDLQPTSGGGNGGGDGGDGGDGDDGSAAIQPQAAIALAALFGGAAVLANGL